MVMQILVHVASSLVYYYGAVWHATSLINFPNPQCYHGLFETMIQSWASAWATSTCLKPRKEANDFLLAEREPELKPKFRKDFISACKTYTLNCFCQ